MLLRCVASFSQSFVLPSFMRTQIRTFILLFNAYLGPLGPHGALGPAKSWAPWAPWGLGPLVGSVGPGPAWGPSRQRGPGPGLGPLVGLFSKKCLKKQKTARDIPHRVEKTSRQCVPTPTVEGRLTRNHRLGIHPRIPTFRRVRCQQLRLGTSLLRVPVVRMT